eukprot:m.54061 g.54061  ORF g.54061 m.54061 type:complete len:222 (+) comp34306_c1_seq1:484-1149(+)
MTTDANSRFSFNDDVRQRVPVPETPPTRSEFQSAELLLTPDRPENPSKKKNGPYKPKARRSLTGGLTKVDSLFENPVTNSSRILEQKLAVIQGSQFDIERALEDHLQDETVKEELMRKSSKAVNVPKDVSRYTNLPPVQVTKTVDVCLPPVKQKASSAGLTQSKGTSKTDQDVMSMYTPDLEFELPDWSVDVPLPSAEPRPLPSSAPYDFHRLTELWRTPP